MSELRIAATADLHLGKLEIHKEAARDSVANVDLFLIAGDITNSGSREECLVFRDLLSGIQTPTVVVLGNHDCHSRSLSEVESDIKNNDKIRVIDGSYESLQIGDLKVGILGTKGFGGGFSPHRLIGYGEDVMKDFAEEELREVNKLRYALKQSSSKKSDILIALTHYAPFVEPTEGEPLQYQILMGSSKMGELLTESGVDLCVHGHAHKGSKGIFQSSEGKLCCNVGYKVNDMSISTIRFKKKSDDNEYQVTMD